jgi:hypothetical protein
MGSFRRNHAISLLAIVAAGFFTASAYAAGGLSLWTTMDDFSVVPSGNAGWNQGNAGEQTLTPVTTPDSDGSAIDGAGNFTTPGAAGTPGALSVQWGSGTFNFFYSPDLIHIPDLLAVMGTQGIVKYDFKPPTIHVGTYFSLGLILNYDNHFGPFFLGTPSATANANGYFTNTITYTGFVAANAVNYFQMGVIYNSDYSPLDPYYVDNFRLIGQGDFNEDGHVDAKDISSMESALTNPTAYENTFGLTAANLITIGDFNGDGQFTNADLQGFLNYLKNGKGGTSAVPEPASLVLLGLAIPALTSLAYRRRKSSKFNI